MNFIILLALEPRIKREKKLKSQTYIQSYDFAIHDRG